MNIQSEPARTGRKISQVLEGAREVFMRDGFEGASVDDIAAALAAEVTQGDVVLIKGSKASRVARVVDALRKLSHPHPNQDNEGR